eukprot:IDg6263t1
MSHELQKSPSAMEQPSDPEKRSCILAEFSNANVSTIPMRLIDPESLVGSATTGVFGGSERLLLAHRSGVECETRCNSVSSNLPTSDSLLLRLPNEMQSGLVPVPGVSSLGIENESKKCGYNEF